jgi:hypothetical protein
MVFEFNIDRCRAVTRSENLEGLSVLWWAQSAPLVDIGLTVGVVIATTRGFFVPFTDTVRAPL